MQREHLPPVVIRIGADVSLPETPTGRLTELAGRLVLQFGINSRCYLSGRLTKLGAPDNLTAIHQWLAQTSPELLFRNPTDDEWAAVVLRFAEALRAL